MRDEIFLKRYVVKWQTKRGPGVTFYSGEKTVYAVDAEHARVRAQHAVWREMFQDFTMGHIEIVQVERAEVMQS
jgi:hypothetical protein